MLVDTGPVHRLRHQVRGVVQPEDLEESKLTVPNLFLEPEKGHREMADAAYPAPLGDADSGGGVRPQLEVDLLAEVREQGLEAKALSGSLHAPGELRLPGAERDALLRHAPVLQEVLASHQAPSRSRSPCVGAAGEVRVRKGPNWKTRGLKDEPRDDARSIHQVSRKAPQSTKVLSPRGGHASTQLLRGPREVRAVHREVIRASRPRSIKVSEMC